MNGRAANDVEEKAATTRSRVRWSPGAAKPVGQKRMIPHARLEASEAKYEVPGPGQRIRRLYWRRRAPKFRGKS